MKKSPPLLTHYAGERSPPAPWVNDDGDFFGDNFFGSARAECRTPYLRNASLASFVELSTSACCRILPANLGCKNCASNVLDKVAAGGSPEKLFENIFLGPVLPETLPEMCADTFWEERACL